MDGRQPFWEPLAQRFPSTLGYSNEIMTRLSFLSLVGLFVCLASPTPLQAADLTGKWDFVWDTEGGERRGIWVIAQDGETVTAESEGQTLRGTFSDGRLQVEGKFYSAEAGYSSTLKVEGRLEDGVLKGSGSWDQYGMTFTAKPAE